MSKDHQHKNISRRKFLGSFGCAGLGVTSLLSGITNLGLMNAAAAANRSIYMPPSCGDYKALVCIYLGGGNDSFNMLVPYDNEEYDAYAESRSNMAIEKDDLLAPISDSSGKQFGLHPALNNLKSMYENGDAAFLANVGTLVKKFDSVTALNNDLQSLPLGLYSHLDQTNHWHTGLPDQRTNIGWCGRLADQLYTCNENENISMNISLDGTNILQRGNSIIEYAINNNGSKVITDYQNGGDFYDAKRLGLDSLLDQSYQNILQTAYANTVKQATGSASEFNAAINESNMTFDNFEGTPGKLSDKLKMVAKTIGARDLLNMSRQTFFVSLSGFDTHGDNDDSNSLIDHAALLEELDQSLKYFYDALEEMNMLDQVTIFTMSDFGRTLTSNGNGTDHGWGGNSIMIGGAVNGGDVYGEYPSLALATSNQGNELDTDLGRLIPTTSCDEYFSELALWFAHNGNNTLTPTELTDILPNINEFWDSNNINSINNPNKPIGFMNM